MGTEWKLDTQLRASLERIEQIVKRLQDPAAGVQLITVKSLFNTTANVCTGADIVTWLVNALELKSRTEALNLARTIAKYGYIFVAGDSKLTVKDDLTYHRFQDPYFWPTKERSISNTDYAIHLCKRLFSNKPRANLEVYEMDQFTRLQQHLAHKWEHIWLRAEADYNVDKKKRKAEQHIIESQEKAFWNLHKPPPYSDYVLAGNPLKFKEEFSKTSSGSVERPSSAPSNLQRHKGNEEQKTRYQVNDHAKSIEGLIAYCDLYSKFDPLMKPAVIDDANYSDVTSRKPSSYSQTEKWAISLEELLKDKEGVLVFLKHLEKEHSSENLRFWIDCEDYKACPVRKIKEKANLIYKDFFTKAAPYQVNLDSHLIEEVKEGLKEPNHFTFYAAQQEIFRLMRADSYPRFLKSEYYLMVSREANNPVKGQEKKSILSILSSPQHKAQ